MTLRHLTLFLSVNKTSHASGLTIVKAFASKYLKMMKVVDKKKKKTSDQPFDHRKAAASRFGPEIRHDYSNKCIDTLCRCGPRRKRGAWLRLANNFTASGGE
jgi:hypothetical protein